MSSHGPLLPLLSPSAEPAKHPSPALPASGVIFHPAVPAMYDRRPRRISPEAYEADRFLSHAIEYLVDAGKLPNGRLTELDHRDPHAQAVLLLMEARYQIYVACPVIERRSKNPIAGLFKGRDRRRS